MIEIFAGATTGLVAGRVVGGIAKRLPERLFRQWRVEAAEVLDLGVDEANAGISDNPPPLHALQRGYMPEIACALLSALVLLAFGLTTNGAAMLVLTWGLLVLVLIDAEHQILPDVIVLPLLWLGLIANQQGLFVRLDKALYGAIAGYLVLWVMLTGFKVCTGRDGMGRGDLKMLAMLGAWVGWQHLPLIVIIASTSAAVYGIAVQRFIRTGTSPQIPFGPFLALGGFTAMLWGHAIIRTYLQ